MDVAAVDVAEHYYRKIQRLREDLLTMNEPIVKVMMKAECGLKSIVINTETGEITREYYDWAQKILDDCEKLLEANRSHIFREIDEEMKYVKKYIGHTRED
jgi:hypothetical protein